MPEHCQYHLPLPPEGPLVTPPPGGGEKVDGTVQSSGKMVGVFPRLLTTHLGLYQIISNNVWFLVN